jgi:hypothetical protein
MGPLKLTSFPLRNEIMCETYVPSAVKWWTKWNGCLKGAEGISLAGALHILIFQRRFRLVIKFWNSCCGRKSDAVRNKTVLTQDDEKVDFCNRSIFVVLLLYMLTYLLTLLTYLLTYSLTHSLTPWCRKLFEKLTVTQLVKKILLSYGTRRFSHKPATGPYPEPVESSSPYRSLSP